MRKIRLCPPSEHHSSLWHDWNSSEEESGEEVCAVRWKKGKDEAVSGFLVKSGLMLSGDTWR